METCFNYCYEYGDNDNKGWFSSDEKRWINRIHKLKEKYPDQVVIKAEPEDNDGCIYCYVPQSWLRIQPPNQMSEDKLEALRERARVAFGTK